MPVAFVAFLVAAIALMFATLILIAWFMVNAEAKVRQLPGFVGNPIANLINGFIDLNKQAAAFWYNQLVSPLISSIRDLVGWIGQAIHVVFTDAKYLGTLIKDVVLLAVMPAILPLIAQINGLLGYVNTIAIPGFAELRLARLALQNQINGLLGFANTIAIPALNLHSAQISGILGYINGTAIPLLRTLTSTINGAVGAINTQIFPRIQDLENQMTILITKPITGALDRIRGLERDVAQVLPIWGALALTIPLARTLARVARNPCTCLEESGQTDMLPLLLYLFEEAG